MSAGFATDGVPLYRVATGAWATPVTHATLNANQVFNTNIPSLDYYMNIRRIRWWVGHTAFAFLAGPVSAQLFVALSESSTKTTIAPTDTNYLDLFMYEYDHMFSTAAGFENEIKTPEAIVTHDFPWGVPTIATKLNVVATLVENVSNVSTNNFLPACAIEFEFRPLSNTIRDFLAKRIQIQQ